MVSGALSPVLSLHPWCIDAAARPGGSALPGGYRTAPASAFLFLMVFLFFKDIDVSTMYFVHTYTVK